MILLIFPNFFRIFFISPKVDYENICLQINFFNIPFTCRYLIRTLI